MNAVNLSGKINSVSSRSNPDPLIFLGLFKQIYLQGKVKNCYKTEKEKHRETKMAYVDIAPKAPRSIQKAQVLIQHSKVRGPKV